MIEAFRNVLRVGDLRTKLLYTAGLLLVFRIGTLIPVPGVDASLLRQVLNVDQGSVFSMLNLFAGGALGRFAVLAMGVTPYITASIILQLLTAVVPSLEELKKDSEGRKKIQEYTRYGTVVLGLIQGASLALLANQYGVIANPNFGTMSLIVITLTAGTTFLMWLGEQISEYGIGNGISLLIFAGIIAELPVTLLTAGTMVSEGALSAFSVLAWLLLTVAIVAGIILVQEAQRRIPVQYARRQVGRRMMGGGSTHIPLKINQAGVIPVIFANSVLLFPLTIAQFVPALSGLERWIGFNTPGYFILYVLMVIFFTYFYTAVTFNPSEVAENMKKNGGFIPGLRPGRPTSQYLDRVLARITLSGAVFLAIVALSPHLVAAITRMPQQFQMFGGTGLIIIVGVALDTMKQIEAQLLMRHYEGFMKG